MKRAPKQYHYSHWDEDEINALMRLRGEGKSTAEIAEALGRTYWAVANAIYRIRKGERYGKRL